MQHRQASACNRLYAGRMINQSDFTAPLLPVREPVREIAIYLTAR